MEKISRDIRITQIKDFICVAIVLGFIFWNGCERKKESTSSFYVYSIIDTSSATIGDVLHFQAWAKGAGKRVLKFPDIVIDDPNISTGERKTVEGTYSDDYGVEFEIAFWDTGSFVLPPYSVNVMSVAEDSVDYTITTDPIEVTVQTVIKDSQPELRDIKPPVPIPIVLPFRLIISLILILILLGVLVWVWRKRIPGKRDETKIYIPSKPPYEIAMDKLERLRKLDVSKPDYVKEFYTGLSYIVREFLEYQYFVRAIEMTTEEILYSKSYLPLSRDLMDRLLDVLMRADLAKFARFQPDRNQCLGDLSAIENFVTVGRLEWLPIKKREHRMEAL